MDLKEQIDLLSSELHNAITPQAPTGSAPIDFSELKQIPRTKTPWMYLKNKMERERRKQAEPVTEEEVAFQKHLEDVEKEVLDAS